MFFSMFVAAAVAADETVAVTSSLAERELKADVKLISNGTSDGSSVVSYFVITCAQNNFDVSCQLTHFCYPPIQPCLCTYYHAVNALRNGSKDHQN